MANAPVRETPLPGFEAAVRFVVETSPGSLNALAAPTAEAVPAAALHLAAAEEGWLPLLSALLPSADQP